MAVIKKKWKRGKKLGEGAFAKVYLVTSLAVDNNSNTNSLALKSCLLSNSIMLCQEKLLLEKFRNCPYIINSFGDNVTVQNGERFYNVFLEYASGGSLFDQLKHGGLHESEVNRYAESILKGLDYVHKKGYAHCDIKPENILLVEKESSFVPKIADFGLAKKADKKLGEDESGIRGTFMYLAPESFINRDYDPKVDIWAFGCTVLQMITGKTPWDKKSEPAAVMFKLVMKKEIPEIPEWVSGEARDFLEKCLVWDPESRWSAEMLLRHPFITSMANIEKIEEAEEMERVDVLIKPYFVLPEDKKRKRTEMIAEEGLEFRVNWFGLISDHLKKTKMMIPSVNTRIEIFD